jgi:hypothetical protein
MVKGPNVLPQTFSTQQQQQQQWQPKLACEKFPYFFTPNLLLQADKKITLCKAH